MDIELLNHNYSLVYDKLIHIREHSGDGAIVHHIGHLANMIFNYNHLMNKEYKNPVMIDITWEYYANKMVEYMEKGKEFLADYANNMVDLV